MSQKKLTKKKTKEQVVLKIEKALAGYKLANKAGKFKKLIKKTSGILAEFIVEHSNKEKAVKKSAAIKPQKKLIKSKPTVK